MTPQEIARAALLSIEQAGYEIEYGHCAMTAAVDAVASAIEAAVASEREACARNLVNTIMAVETLVASDADRPINEISPRLREAFLKSRDELRALVNGYRAQPTKEAE